MQHQMLVTGFSYCDFFVWLEGTDKEDKFLIRVQRDQAFIDKLITKLETVFYKVVLPELYTRQKDPENESIYNTYCICNRPSFNPMIACDGPKCKIEWFHYSCVGIKRAPSKKWFCSNCKDLMNQT